MNEDIAPRPRRRVSVEAYVESQKSTGQPAPAGTYEVGYGKPPVERRIKKGEVRNPRGRPKGSKNFGTLLKEALDKKVRVTENGRSKLVPKREIGATRFANRVMDGEPKVIEAAIRIEGQGSSSTRATAQASVQLQSDERELYDELIAEMKMMARGGGE